MRFRRNASKHLTHTDVLAVANNHESAHRQLNRHCVIRTRDLHFIAVFIDQVNQRAQDASRRALSALRSLLRIDHNKARKPRHFIDLIHHGNVFNNVLKLNAAGVLRNNRTGHRIPGSKLLSGLNRLPILNQERGAVRYLVAFTFTTVIHHNDFTGTRNHHEFTLGRLHEAHCFIEAHRAGRLGLDTRCNCSTGRRTTNVERTHRQLRTRLTNRLSCDNADRLACVNQRAAAEITTIALGAQTVAGITGQRRTNLDHVNTNFVKFVAKPLIQQGAGSDHNFMRIRIDDVNSSDTTENTITQRLNDFTAFHKRTHLNAASRTAVVLDHHKILRHVNETTGEVARVCRLQRRISQTLTSTVG